MGVTIVGGAVAVGGAAITYFLLKGEAILAVPTLGGSLLLTGETIATGTTIMISGGYIIKIGVDTIMDALSEGAHVAKNKSGPCPPTNGSMGGQPTGVFEGRPPAELLPSPSEAPFADLA